MRGNDCTPEQLKAAEEFLDDFAAIAGQIGTENVLTRKSDLVRLLAWYGAIRYQASEEGHGSLEQPAPLNMRKPDYMEI